MAPSSFRRRSVIVVRDWRPSAFEDPHTGRVLRRFVGLSLLLVACGGAGGSKPTTATSAGDSSAPHDHVNDCSWYDSPELAESMDAPTRERLRSVCELEVEFLHFLEDRRACSSDSDCQVIVTKCPFGCGIAAAAAQADEIHAKHDELSKRYHEDAADCSDPCEPPPGVACEGGQCVRTD